LALENLEKNRNFLYKQSKENNENLVPNYEKTIVKNKFPSKSPLSKGNLQKALNNFQNNGAKAVINIYSNKGVAMNIKEVSPFGGKKKGKEEKKETGKVGLVDKTTYNSGFNLKLAQNSIVSMNSRMQFGKKNLGF